MRATPEGGGGGWRGEGGVNVSYDYEQKKVIEETYTEEITFKIVGDVDNGEQKIWCLDYITAAKRTGSDDIFHTELGFWGWDPVRGEVMRCFMVPRMSTILAGGTAKADDTSSFLMESLFSLYTTGSVEPTPGPPEDPEPVSTGDPGTSSSSWNSSVSTTRLWTPSPTSRTARTCKHLCIFSFMMPRHIALYMAGGYLAASLARPSTKG